MRIGICEDDESLLNLIEIILQDNKSQIFKCCDAGELVDTALNKKIDVLLVDYWLKAVTAESAIKQIQKANPSLPIILMSAVTNLPTLAQKLGIETYVKKPFDIDNLKQVILNVYESTHSSNRG